MAVRMLLYTNQLGFKKKTGMMSPTSRRSVRIFEGRGGAREEALGVEGSDGTA